MGIYNLSEDGGGFWGRTHTDHKVTQYTSNILIYEMRIPFKPIGAGP